jgi:hypothetical protein
VPRHLPLESVRIAEDPRSGGRGCETYRWHLGLCLKSLQRPVTNPRPHGLEYFVRRPPIR